MAVRPAIWDDLATIVDIYNHAITETVATFDTVPVTLAEREAWFEGFDIDNPLRVSEIDGIVGGFAYYLPYRAKPAYDLTRETTVYVSPRCRGRGVASELYAALIEHARRHGVHTLIAVIAGDNPASVALHRKFGFAQIGHLREVGHKFGAWVDTRYFQLLL